MNILVIEFNDFHTETLPIYREFLPFLFPESAVRIRYYIPNYSYMRFPRSELDVRPLSSRLAASIAARVGATESFHKTKIKSLIRNLKPDVLVFNSIEPLAFYKELAKEVPATIKQLAIVHNPRLVVDSGFKFEYGDYYVLGDKVYETWKDYVNGYMLPFYSTSPLLESARDDSENLIGIQGIVDYARRDYPLLVRIATALKKAGNPSGCRFNIIGVLGKEKLQREVESSGLTDMFIFHNKLSDDCFNKQIAKCQFIMPLLGLAHGRYLSDKITASYSHSAAHRIPLILSGPNAAAWGLDHTNSVIYETEQCLVDILGDLPSAADLRGQYISFINKKIEENKAILTLT